MDKLKKLALLEKLKDYDKEVMNNKKVLDNNKEIIKVNNKKVRKVHKDIYKSILLFIASTSSLGALTYGGYAINSAIIESENTSQIDNVINSINKTKNKRKRYF